MAVTEQASLLEVVTVMHFCKVSDSEWQRKDEWLWSQTELGLYPVSRPIASDLEQVT